MSRTLIVINSWVGGCRKGVHKAQRATFLKDVAGVPGLDYKIFCGDGTGTGEDESAMLKSFAGAHPLTQGKNYENLAKMPCDYTPLEDDVLLQVPDDMVHIAHKARAAWRWALAQRYDHVFNCFCDTYIDISRLMNSGFEQHDFIGMTYDANRCPQGGAGYWLSKRCMEILATAHVDFWADDGWAGWTLQKHGIHLHHDPRYGQFADGAFPAKTNDVITAHMGPHPYKIMREIHAGQVSPESLKGTLYDQWCDKGGS